ncbi:MAG TPA: hypothetical protein ENJ37_08020 [Deltaproteobacteria bacterium]|nr:hypothetical protein [Deltaproteobacteria bacterium]
MQTPHFLQKLVYGDATADSLDDIWRGESIRRMRSLMKEGRNSELALCRNCSFLYVNDWTI